MPTVAELLKDHVTLEVECIDRIYLNGYIPSLQTGGNLVTFLTKHREQPIPSPALLGKISEEFRADVKQFATENSIPIIEFKRGQRKDEIALERRREFTAHEGVVFIGVAQEKSSAFKATKKKTEGGFINFHWDRQSVAVNHYYYYLEDREFGPAFIKVCSYAPYGIRVYLNGHEWAKKQLAHAGIPFESLDNGFKSCADPERLQAICDSLGPEQIQDFFDRWLPRLPYPLTPQDRAAGYQPKLSIWQMEISLTQVFAKPTQGRQFFENVLRDNLDLGRPDHVQLVFGQQIRKNTPSRFRTRVIQHGVLPSLHLEYKHSQVKQYFKENHALRTETTINDPGDFHINKGLSNFDYLQKIGRNINRRLLDAQQTASPCGLSQATVDHVVQPTVTHDGQRAPGLRLGDSRTRALFLALVLFIHVVQGFTNSSLRSQVATFLGTTVTSYKANQMTYDLRRLRLKGLIVRLPGTNRYILTTHGRRVALFFAKLDGRIFGQASWAIDAKPESAMPKSLTRALHQVDLAIDDLLRDSVLRTVPRTAA
ncbi:MAG: hypothetical protein M1379_16025 [Firmicutes bacterium]|nr:hypothetical protein [Bacillota bacterium]